MAPKKQNRKKTPKKAAKKPTKKKSSANKAAKKSVSKKIVTKKIRSKKAAKVKTAGFAAVVHRPVMYQAICTFEQKNLSDPLASEESANRIADAHRDLMHHPVDVIEIH